MARGAGVWAAVWAAVLGALAAPGAEGSEGQRVKGGLEPGRRACKLRRPDGSKVSIAYNVPSAADVNQYPQGVYDFELFPQEDARRLIGLLEEWDEWHQNRGNSLWTQNLDNVDLAIENQLNIFKVSDTENDDRMRPYKVKGWKALTNGPYTTPMAVPFSNLVKALCINVYEPFLREVLGHTKNNQCNGLFFRRYLVESGRTKIVAHEDQDLFTFNVALSDKTTVSGGSLYLCRLLPQRFQDFLSAHVSQEDRTSPRWLELMEPYGILDATTFENDVCALRQGHQGRVAGHTSSRLHGVQPVRGDGVRYSLIAFMGTRQTDEARQTPPSKKLEPMSGRHMEAYLNMLRYQNHLMNRALHVEGGNYERLFELHKAMDDEFESYYEWDAFFGDVLPALEFERFHENVSVMLSLLRLVRSMLDQATVMGESLVHKREKEGSHRILAALKALLGQPAGDVAIVAEACGLAERLGCLVGGEGLCGQVAGLCPQGVRIPPVMRCEGTERCETEAELDRLWEQCGPTFYKASKVKLAEPVDPECAKLWLHGGGRDLSRFAGRGGADPEL